MLKFEHLFKFLRDKWNLQLYHEYENICYRYGVKLKKPLIHIGNYKNSWGFWDKNRRTIVINEELIKKYSWDIVIQVLKHEIAHQIVSDIFKIEEEHGNYFKKACEILGIEKEFSQASISMDYHFEHWKNKEINKDENSLLKKIEKLLSLAQSSNEHEAALAMERVQELYEKYNIQNIKLGYKQNYYTLIINFKKRRVPLTHSIAAYILQHHFFVSVIFSSLYDPMEDCSHKTIEIMGTRQNVLMAEYVFHFLISQIEILWNQYAKKVKQNTKSKYKLSYQQGILEGFLKKLDFAKEARDNQNSKMDPSFNLLMKTEDRKLKEYVNYKHPKVTKRGTSAGSIYTEHFQEGLNEGKKINLHRPVHEKKGNNTALLFDRD